MRKIAGLIVGLIVLLSSMIGCVRYHYYEYPQSQYRTLDVSRVEVGMSDGEVLKKLGEPAYVAGYRFYKDATSQHTVKVTQYMEAERYFNTDASSNDNLKRNYYLYFLDDRLVHISNLMANSKEDWQKESDKIYEFRSK
jgi:outer membrane protein assembly factor BamE (lipoprotein component of BamABCDE complex)